MAPPQAQAKLLSLDAARVLMLAEELGGARSRPPLEFFFTQVQLVGKLKAVEETNHMGRVIRSRAQFFFVLLMRAPHSLLLLL